MPKIGFLDGNNVGAFVLVIVVENESRVALFEMRDEPSDHPEFAEFLVECGIDSISVVPDSFISVKNHVAEAESRRN